ncbi:endonuclease/exonuclease/phosphatase family protein [Parasediminibacterium sp. JCM 36343]|uniref:endonuclease/exonuclease/phosphatase family protein n=1 Tax=Parasediminibacterium sp. JCM 36343 TaxID=3374279 RepID=UPI00397A3B6D
MIKKDIARTTARIIMQALTIVIGLCFLMACMVPWLSPKNCWWIGFAGLAAPYLIGLLIFAIIFWLLVKPRWALLPITLLVLGYKQLDVVFAWHFKTSFSDAKSNDAIRILDWNVRGFNGLSESASSKKIIRTELAESILKQNPDIICLQEFNHSYGTAGHPNLQADNIGLFTKTHPYYYFSRDYKTANGYASGSIIFSKYPIIDTGKLKYPKGESIIFADMVIGGDTLRIYTTHLQSFKFKKGDYDNIDKIADNEDDALLASKSVFNKMKPAFKRRAEQAGLVKQWLGNSPYRSIITGDFNDVPNSYTYFTIKGDRQDAFLEKYFGFGRSYISLAPTLRIDYILPDTSFLVQQFDMEDEGLSDHIMLISDVKLK